jgi:SAM-dependent methyltransferase
MAAGDVDYSVYGHGYSQLRRPDQRIAAQIARALDGAQNVLNVGAGTGSYEPEDRYVVAVEPNATMRAQRTKPAVIAYAQELPFDNQAFDATMAILTVHQWTELERGIQELRRVTLGPIVLMTFDPEAMRDFWLMDYVPELAEVERRRFPTIERLGELLCGEVRNEMVPLAQDCTDGFAEAFYNRPEAFLQEEVRRAQSGWSFLPEEVVNRTVQSLRDDLESGRWDQSYGYLRGQPTYEGSLRLVISESR